MSLTRVLDVQAVAAHLGFSEASVRAMLRRGEIPGLRIGGQWRVKESALERLFERRERELTEVGEHAVRVLRGVRNSRRRVGIVVPPKTSIAPDDKKA